MSIITEILAVSPLVKNNRTASSVLLKVMEEVGELAVEVSINAGTSYKIPGKDGIKGEVVDAIAALVDLLYVIDNDITEAELVDICKVKLAKWVDMERRAAKCGDK